MIQKNIPPPRHRANSPFDRQINIVQRTALIIRAEVINSEENCYLKREIVKIIDDVVQRPTKITLSRLSASLAGSAQNSRINVRVPVADKRQNSHRRISQRSVANWQYANSAKNTLKTRSVVVMIVMTFARTVRKSPAHHYWPTLRARSMTFRSVNTIEWKTMPCYWPPIHTTIAIFFSYRRIRFSGTLPKACSF